MFICNPESETRKRSEEVGKKLALNFGKAIAFYVSLKVLAKVFESKK